MYFIIVHLTTDRKKSLLHHISILVFKRLEKSITIARNSLYYGQWTDIILNLNRKEETKCKNIFYDHNFQ